MMRTRTQHYAGNAETPGASDRKHSDADDLDFDFSMIVDVENDGLDFTLNNADGIHGTIQEHMQTDGNLPSHSSQTPSIPIPSASSTGAPAVTATASSPLHPPKKQSQARAIPQKNNDQSQHVSSSATFSRPGSHESSGSAFLNGIMNPAGATFNNTQLSHTPPNVMGTSYENSHFGKRQRSGSVSGRLRSASDLEEKGLIDRNQKSILKDLIICGDEDLQYALDLYEGGNPAVLEKMISSGTLQNKAIPDLDLLGDLDLDFLTVNDVEDAPESGERPGMYTLSQQQGDALASGGKLQPARGMKPPPPRHNSRGSTGAAAKPSPSMVSAVYDDGIGELEFTGEFAGEHEDNYENHMESHSHHAIGLNHRGNPQRSGTETPPIEDYRLRSNSLFSALISDPHESGHHDVQYGRWMDHVPKAGQSQMQALLENGNTTQTIPILNKSVGNDGPTRKTPGRRKSDSAVTMDRKVKTRIKQELAEQKRREKQEKREQKEREKQEKKEARVAAKVEKKKKKEQNKKEQAMEIEEEEKPVHVPGSGRPRSLSDPSLRTKTDEFGLVEVERPDGWVGAYSPESRKVRIEKFLAKRNNRVWTKTVKYDVRKNFADSRLRVKGRFVKKEDEMLMRDLMSLT